MNCSTIGADIGGTEKKGGIVDLSEGKLLGEPLCVLSPKPASTLSVAEVMHR